MSRAEKPYPPILPDRATRADEADPCVRRVIHLDVSAFAVAVERVREPRLADRPVLIAPQTPRARVLSLSDEARAAGIRRGQSLEAAVRLCRDSVVIAPDEPLYARAAEAVREILARFTPVVEPVGYGRAFLDVTGTGRLFGPATDVASRVQREVQACLRLPASAGVAVNKLVSRVAADTCVPAGLIEVRPGDEAPFLAPFPVRRLPGIGRDVARDLEDLSIRIVRDLATVSVGHLTLAFGRFGIVLHQQALGFDPTPVRPPEREETIVEQDRLTEDTSESASLFAALQAMVARAARALRRKTARAGRIDLTIRYADDRTASGRFRLAAPSDLDVTLMGNAWRLAERIRRRRVRVRGMTLRCGALEHGPRQMSLFEEPSLRRSEALAAALDGLEARGWHVGRARASEL